MKKKLLSALLAALLVLSMIPFAFAGTATATEPGNVAYLDEANGNDETAELNNVSAPYGTFPAAYNALCPAGGTLKLISPYTNSTSIDTSSNALHTHYGEILITADGESENYWETPARIVFAGKVKIANITLHRAGTTVFAANYNPLTMGEGIVCLGHSTSGNASATITDWSKSPYYVIGGAFGTDRCLDTNLTVLSGTWYLVAGGNRNEKIIGGKDISSADNKCIQLGTCCVTFGGTAKTQFLMGLSLPASDYFAPGGQAYIYLTGGSAYQVEISTNRGRMVAVEDNILVWTGGTIGSGTNLQLKACRTPANISVFYGSDVTLNAPYTPNSLIDGSAADLNSVFTSGGVNVGVPKTATSKINVLPLRTGTDTTVYVSQATGTYYNPGTETAPVSSLANAYAMLTYTGGTIVLLDDYTFTATELTMYKRFNEPLHDQLITVKGVTPDVKLICPKAIESTILINTTTYDNSTGFNAWYMHGDTTFEDVTFELEDTGACSLVANFNALTLGEGVTCSSLRLVGGTLVQSMDYQKTPYREYSAPYTAFYDESYAYWSDKDPSITVNSETAKVWITGFSRLLRGSPATAYPGTANITIEKGTVSSLFPAPTNRLGATGSAAAIAINGGIVKDLYEGGDVAGKGAITDNLNITVGENAAVENYHNIGNAPASFTMKVNSTYSSYLIAKNTYTQANVTTDITADTYRDSIDAVLGFGLKDNGADGVKIRYGAKLKDYIVDDPDFTVKEFGVLIKNANNATALEWFDSDAQLTYQNKVAKKIAYKAGTEMNYYDYDPANGNDVQFYTTLTGISEARYETEYVFRAYMVVTVNGVDQVVYGAESADSAYTIAQRLTSSNETAAKVIDAVENAGA